MLHIGFLQEFRPPTRPDGLATLDIEDSQIRIGEGVLCHSTQIIHQLQSNFGDTIGNTRAVKPEGGVFVSKKFFWKYDDMGLDNFVPVDGLTSDETDELIHEEGSAWHDG